MPLRDRKKETWRYATAMLILAMLISSSVVLPGANVSELIISGTSPDYGIFDRISKLNDEGESRKDDPEVASRAQEAFSTIRTVPHVFQDIVDMGFQRREIEVPEPLEHSPVIFDALNANPVINNTSILDWILPPPLSEQGTVNYLVLSHHPSGDRWFLGSMVPRIGMFTDSSLDKWIYIDVDGDSRTGDASGNDIRVRMTFARDILERDWEINLIPPSVVFRNAGMRLEVESTTGGSGSGVGGSVYFIKAISYQDRNYIWSVGFELEEYMDRMEVRVQAREWRSEPLSSILTGGGIGLGDLRLLEILGPYTLEYSFDTAPEQLSILISIMRMLERELLDRAYARIDLENDLFHESIIDRGRLVLKVSSADSPIEGLEWVAGRFTPPDANDTLSLRLEYTEFGSDVIFARFAIPLMPSMVSMDIANYEERGKDVTRLDIRTASGIQSASFLEVVHSPAAERQEAQSIATIVEMKGIPSHIKIITTSAGSFDIDEDPNAGSGFLDALMNQVAGRFYRVGSILRDLPRSIMELPSSKGWTEIDCMGGSIFSIEFAYGEGKYLALEGGDFLALERSGEGTPSISGRLSGLERYSASFIDGNDMSLRLKEPKGLEVLARDDDRTVIVSLAGIPSEISISTDGDGIAYRGASQLGSISYRYREDDLLFDVDINGLPTGIDMARSASGVVLGCVGGSIGSVEMFVSNSSTLRPLSIPSINHVTASISEGNVALAMRITGLSSLVYDNSSRGYVQVVSDVSSDMVAVIDDADTGMTIRAALSPLPRSFKMDFPSVIERPQFDLPDLRAIRDIYGYAELIFSIAGLSRAVLQLASGISEGMTNAIGQYSAGLDLSWDLSGSGENMDLFVEIEKIGPEPVNPSSWTHGIWMEQKGMGADSSVSGKIFLGGMPTKGVIGLSFSEETILALMDFKGFRPPYDWLLIRTNGVQDRDISMYITGIERDIDLYMNTNITTDLSIGGKMVILMDARITRTSGEGSKLGEMIATLTKATPILSVRQMYLPEIPSEFFLEANIEQGVSAVYKASSEIEYLFFKITKKMDGRWSQIYAIFHDLPLSFGIEMESDSDFTVLEPFPLQGLPMMDITTSSPGMDIFIEYDGSGFGQRGRFQITARDIGTTRTFYEDGAYVMDSEGIGFISIDVGKLPMMEAFSLEGLMLLGLDVEHFSLKIDMAYGVYPVVTIDDLKGGAIQIKLSVSLNAAGRDLEPSIFFATMRFRRPLGLPVVTGLSISRDTAAIEMSRSDGIVLVPAPVLTGWYYLIEVLLGGAG